jgi:hypothetical protein
MNTSSNEKTIRKECRKYLQNNYNDLAIKEEFGVFLDSRNDVMGISHDDIISIEIKSDKDTFLRLKKQLTTYRTFSTKVYVALDEIHLEKYYKQFEEFDDVGILMFKNEKLTLLKKAVKTEFKNLYQLLTSRELTLFFAHFRGKSLIPKDFKTSTTLIEDIFTQDEIFKMSKYIFITRFVPNVPQYVPKELFKDFNDAQAKFTKWLKIENWNMYTYKPFGWLKNDKIPKAKRSSLKCIRKINAEYEVNEKKDK